MKNWMTTLAGLISSLLFLGVKAFWGGGIVPADLPIAAGLTTIGAAAKDFNKTGT